MKNITGINSGVNRLQGKSFGRVKGRKSALQVSDSFTKSSSVKTSPEIDVNKIKQQAQSMGKPEKTETPAHVSHKISLGKKIKHYLKKMTCIAVIAGSIMADPAIAAAASAVTGGEETVNEPQRVEMKVEQEEVKPGGLGIKYQIAQAYDSFDEAFERVEDSNFQTEIGDYKLRTDYFDASIRMRPKVKPKLDDGKLNLDWKLYSQTKVDLLRSELSKTEQQGDWQVSQGLRGGIRGEWKLGWESGDNGSTDDINELKWNVNLDAFKRWDKDLEGGKHLRFDAISGGSHEIVGGNTELHIALQQELTGKHFVIMGKDFDWVTSAKEKLSYDVDDSKMNAEYELFAGVTKKFPMEVFGRKVKAEMKVGPRLKGDLDDPAEIGAVTKFRVKF